MGTAVTRVGFYCLLRRRRRCVVDVVLMADMLLCVHDDDVYSCNDNNMCVFTIVFIFLLFDYLNGSMRPACYSFETVASVQTSE